ncbi:MAG: hypothetical protein AB1540_10650 [Bdellovibrionota bacterium]
MWPLIAMLLSVGVLHSNGAFGASRLSLEELAPMAPRYGSTQEFIIETPQVTQPDKFKIFKNGPTEEAAFRLQSIEREYGEKRKYQLETPSDILNYERSKRDIGLWYVKSLVRFHVRTLVKRSREYYRDQREHRQRQDLARQEARQNSSGVAQHRAEVIRAEVQVETEPDQTHFLTKTIRFLDAFTSDGVDYNRNGLSLRTRLDVQNATILASMHSSVIDISTSYYVLPPAKFASLAKMNRDTNRDPLVVVVGRRFDDLGLALNTGYTTRKKELGATATKQVAGPLVAQVAQSWNTQTGEVLSFTAQLTLVSAF